MFQFGCAKLNGSKGDVFCFGKSQQGVTFSCSRLKLRIRFVALDKVSS